jgi:hypothetical protein
MLAALMLTGISASAQVKWGVTAGMNFNAAEVSDIRLEAKAGWSAGVSCLVDLPLGFSIQPSLVYIQKGADYSLVDALQLEQKVGSINLPVSVQWGPDLLIARPFLDVTPYIGYSLSNKLEGGLTGLIKGETKLDNAFEYGVGLGAGINVWKVQAVVRYNWNFGTLGKFSDFKNIDLDDFDVDNEAFSGVSVSLAYFF